MPKMIFIIFQNVNFLVTVLYIPFVEAILGSFELIFLNRQFLLFNVLYRLFRKPVHVNQWRMEIGNFNNSISNPLSDYAFYLSKSLIIIAYLLYLVLFKHIVNWTLVLAIFNAIFRKKLNILNIYSGRILYCNILYSFTSNSWVVILSCTQVLNLILSKASRSVIGI